MTETPITKLWIVMDGDGDSDWPVAAYSTEILANEHVKLIGGSTAEISLLDELNADAADPVRQREYVEQREKDRLFWARQTERQNQEAQFVEEIRPRPPHMGLCCCQTFSQEPMWNAHGYCRYCGKWAPAVFKEHMGGAAMAKAIADLDKHGREAMQKIIEATP